MKAIFKSLLEAGVVILLVPQLFVSLYFFWPTIHGADGWGMMKSLVIFGLTLSRIASPILYILYLVITSINREKRRSLWSFLICTLVGYASVIVWNIFVYKSFSYAWALLPVILCSSGVVAYQILKDKALMANPKPELFLAS
ncbi:MAG: hypothetical protein WCP12_11565 [bacterium]